MQALVALCARASREALAKWENARDHRRFEADVRGFVDRLRDEQAIAPGEIAERPLALLKALDAFAAAQSRATRQSTPFVLDDGRAYWLLHHYTMGRRGARMNQQPGTLGHWLHHFTMVPNRCGDIEVEVCSCQGTLADALRRLVTAPGQLQCWIGHFDDGCQVEWRSDGQPSGRVRAAGITNPDERCRSLQQTIERARAVRAHVVLLPELSVTPQQRDDVVVESLLQADGDDRPLLFVPGSFHEQVGDACFNSAVLLDGFTGESLLAHRKLRAFGRMDPEGGADFAEAIDVGSRLQVLASAAGNFALLICKDFLDASHEVHGLLQQVPVDWVFVPSYGSEATLERHRQRAREVSRVEAGCHVFVANIRDLGISNGAPLPGFAQGPHDDDARWVDARGGLVIFDKLPQGGPPRPTLRRVR